MSDTGERRSRRDLRASVPDEAAPVTRAHERVPSPGSRRALRTQAVPVVPEQAVRPAAGAGSRPEPAAVTGSIGVVPASRDERPPSRRALRAAAEVEAAAGLPPQRAVARSSADEVRPAGARAVAADAPPPVRVTARVVPTARPGGSGRTSPPTTTSGLRTVPMRRSVLGVPAPSFDEAVAADLSGPADAPADPTTPAPGGAPDGAAGPEADDVDALRPAWAPVTGPVPVVAAAPSLLPTDVAAVPEWPAPPVPSAGPADEDAGDRAADAARPRRRGAPVRWLRLALWTVLAFVLAVLVWILVDRTTSDDASGAASSVVPVAASTFTSTVTTP